MSLGYSHLQLRDLAQGCGGGARGESAGDRDGDGQKFCLAQIPSRYLAFGIEHDSSLGPRSMQKT